MDWPALPVWWDHVWRTHHRRLGPQALQNLPWGIHESRTGEGLQCGQISNSVSSITAVQWLNTADIIARVSQCVWDVPHYLLKMYIKIPRIMILSSAWWRVVSCFWVCHPSQSGPWDVLPWEWVQEHPLLPGLLPCGGDRVEEVWSPGLELLLPVQHWGPHHQCLCAVQLPWGQCKGSLARKVAALQLCWRGSFLFCVLLAIFPPGAKTAC